MQIQTSRFGKILIDESELLLMPHGLIGFETCRHWVMVANPGNEDLAWLQSVGLSNVAIPVISPRRYAPDYRVHVSQRDLHILRLHNEDKLFVLTVVSKNGLTLTTNLKSPILLNGTRKIAAQIVCTNDAPLSWPIGLTSSAQSVLEFTSMNDVDIVRVKAA
jgi:flagellar assembly factor FliW